MPKNYKKLTYLIPKKGTINQLSKFQEISNQIFEMIKDIPNIHAYRLDPEMINLIATSIEYLAKPKYKLDKLGLLKYTLKRAVPELTQEDEQAVEKVVEFLINNHMIQKPKMLSKISFVLKSAIPNCLK